MRILITNNALESRTGSELYARDVAIALLERGHHPIAYSLQLGEIAEELRRATVPVIDDLGLLGSAPDLIHGQHHLETMTALLRFRGVPAVYFCHGWLPWQEAPPHFPRILRYVAVDDACRDRLVLENGIAEDRVRVISNFVDLGRFLPRPQPLPRRPSRALVFSNNASTLSYFPAVREACRQVRVELDVVGLASGNVHARPEKMLGQYDLVFAKGRAALEALAVGAAVVLCDNDGTGPMVTTRELDHLRRLNFGLRCLREAVDAETLARQIARYDPDDAAEVSKRIRATAGLNEAMGQILEVYQEVLSEHRRAGEEDVAGEGIAAAAYLRWLSPRLKDRDRIWLARETLLAERGLPRAERSSSKAIPLDAGDIELESHRLSANELKLQARLVGIQESLGWRLLSKYGRVKHRFIVPAWSGLKRFFARRDKSQKASGDIAAAPPGSGSMS